MSFLNFLGKLLSGDGSLIKIDASKKIILKENSIIFGDQKIDDPKKVEEFYNELRKYKKQDSLPTQVIHRDLFSDYVGYEEISKKESASLKILKGVLYSEDIECILMARRIDIAFKDKNEKLAKKLLLQIDKNYPRKGRKVTNLIKAGYFDQLIIPMIEICRVEHGENYKEKFREFYQNILKFFPIAIFVNSSSTEEWIEEKIKERLRIKNIPTINIHTIGKPNIEKVERVMEKFEKFKEFNIENKNTQLSREFKHKP